MQMKKFFKRNIWIKKSLAFSLIEVLISMALLTLIIGGITLFSVRTIQAHTRSQAMQSALENARFAIESISKMARTSEITSVTNSSLTFTSNDKSIGNVTYAFDDIAKELKFKDSSQDSSLVGGGRISVTGKFDGWKNDFESDSPNKKRGFVAIEMTITYNSGGVPTDADTVKIRSGVSTRY